MKTPPFSIKTLHFVGIGGIGMSGIAEILHDMGYEIQGSDINENVNIQRLRNLGINIYIGHSEENVKNAQVVVISSAVKESNPEVQFARNNLIPIVKRAEMLAELMRLKWGISIAGTHGKTTTTSIVANLLDVARLDPTIVSGGIMNAYQSNARLGSSEWIVVEADESDGSFQKLPSTICAVTNIDPEHLDFYKDFDGLKKAFLNFIETIPFYGLAVLCSDHSDVRSLIPLLKDRRIITYGFRAEADVRAVNIDFTPEGSYFDIEIKNRARRQWTEEQVFNEKLLKKVFLPMQGIHNVQNALVAVCIAQELGIEEDILRQAFKNFSGVKRRFTKTGQVNGIIIIDDYAHHPVEIAATLAAARKTTTGKVIAIVQPHRYSRMQNLFQDYVNCFGDADHIILTPIYSAGEKPIDGVSSEILGEKLIAQGHPSVYTIHSEKEIAPLILKLGHESDIVVCMGAGNITQWAHQLPEELKELQTN